MFVGDISLGEHFFSFGHGPRSLIEKNVSIFDHVKPVFEQADCVIGNLEGPISDIALKRNDPRSKVFRGSPASVSQLKNANINILSVANNHSMQHGAEAFDETVNLLRDLGISVIGIKGEPPLVVTKNDLSIGFLAYSDVPDNEYKDQEKYRTLDIDKCVEDIESTSSNTDVLVVVLHWGIEGRSGPTEDQMAKAKIFREAGADFIIGHHPHVMYEIEPFENGLTAYSLGNFVFDLPWDKRMKKSGILDINIERCRCSKDTIPYRALFWEVGILNNGTPFLSKGHPEKIDDIKKSVYGGFKNQKLSFQLARKISYFIFNIFRGNTSLKLKFLIWKIKCKLQIQR
jgi:poly-gamma-glutamate synthesis protein (capsule biosynthesis protein)